MNAKYSAILTTIVVAIFCTNSIQIKAEKEKSNPSKNSEEETKKLTVTKTSFEDIREQIQEGEAAVTLVHLWATWCPPCRKEFPAIVKIRKTFGKKEFNLILVSADKPSDKARVLAFLEEYNSPIGSLLAENPQKLTKKLPDDWSGGIPASFFYDKEGELQTWWAGAHPFSKYKETIKKQQRRKAE